MHLLLGTLTSKYISAHWKKYREEVQDEYVTTIAHIGSVIESLNWVTLREHCKIARLFFFMILHIFLLKIRKNGLKMHTRWMIVLDCVLKVVKH